MKTSLNRKHNIFYLIVREINYYSFTSG